MGSTGQRQGGDFNILGVSGNAAAVRRSSRPTSTRHSGFSEPARRRVGAARLPVTAALSIGRSTRVPTRPSRSTSRPRKRVGLLSEYRLTNGHRRLSSGSMARILQRGPAHHIATASQRHRRQPDRRRRSSRSTATISSAMTRQHLTDNLWLYGDASRSATALCLREMNLWTLSRGFGNSFNTRCATRMSHFGLIDSFENGYAQLSGYMEPGSDPAAAVSRCRRCRSC